MDWPWLVVVAYQYNGMERGTVISKHKDYDSANRKARQSVSWMVLDALQQENYGGNL
jgi:hypothetical protein